MSDTQPTNPMSSDPSGGHVPLRASLVLLALVVAALVCNLNIAAANVTLPEVGDVFGASQTQLNFVGVGAGLGLSVSVLYFGALADRYGRKQVLILGLSLVIVASVLSAFSPTIEILIFARIFTGFASGMAYPTTLSLITALWVDGPRRTKAIALWSGVSGMASVAGAILAGLLLAVFWWGSAFLLSVPIALVALLLVLKFVPSHVAESVEPVDHLGGVLSMIGIAALVIGISTVFAPGAAGIGTMLLLLAAFLIAVFLWRQKRADNPLFDLTVARQPLFWAPAVSGAIVFGGLVGATFVSGQFLQNALGYSPLQAGLSVIPAAVGLLLFTPVSARLVISSGTRTTMLTGYAFVLVGFITMLFWREDTSYPLIGFGFFVIGGGVAFVMTASSRALTSSTPVYRIGMASGTSDLQRDLGGSIMQALLGAILASGFSKAVADAIGQSKEASSVSAEVARALQSSYASAVRIAEQYPQYHDQIIDAAKQSLVDGALAAYLVGAIAIVIGVVIVLTALPGKKHEQELLGKKTD